MAFVLIFLVSMFFLHLGAVGHIETVWQNDFPS